MEYSKPSTKRMEWFTKAGFGLFIHWGPYSVAGVEASWPIMVREWAWLAGSPRITQKKYKSLAGKFNPTGFDPDEWVRTAKNAGMRYLVFTSKHHDGYCMFDAPGTDYKITNTEFGRDVVAELSEACARHGLAFGLYYSPPDMHHQGFRDTSRPARVNWLGEPDRPEWAGYLDYMEEQLTVLLTQYGHISVIWFDGLFEQERYDPKRFHSLIHRLSPDTLINDRLGDMGDYATPEQGIPEGIPVREQKGFEPATFDADYLKKIQKALKIPILRRYVRKKIREYAEELHPLGSLPTETNPDENNVLPWESCMTMNATWGYCPTDKRWKDSAALLRILVEIKSKGGNFLLNVGPGPDGQFPKRAGDLLSEIGSWMATNGPAVYDVGYGPIQGQEGIRSIARGDTLYIAVLDQPENSTLELSVEKTVTKVRALSDNRSVDFSLSGGVLKFDLDSPVFEGNLPVVYEVT